MAGGGEEEDDRETKRLPYSTHTHTHARARTRTSPCSRLCVGATCEAHRLVDGGSTRAEVR